MGFDDAATVTVEQNDYRTHFWDMCKVEAVNTMKNADLSEKKTTILDYKTRLFYHIMMMNKTPRITSLKNKKQQMRKHGIVTVMRVAKKKWIQKII